tara:strand:+ start:1166 stop:1420 length:255 start_codon:yes stop_codon:yes gene_type:complete
MFSSIILSGIVALSAPTVQLPTVWEKIDGRWAYVGKVQETKQILSWIEKNPKTPTKNLLINEIKKMPFIIFIPEGEKPKMVPLQ